MTEATGSEQAAAQQQVQPLPLDAWHRQRGARLVPFAGYALPIQYDGIIAEHEWTRSHAALFDVSHMGQIIVEGAGATAALEALLPADLAGLKPGFSRYTMLLADDGGILDDLMITHIGRGEGEAFLLVVNGAMKHDDLAHLCAHLPGALSVTMLEDRALLALQGPEAAEVLARQFPGLPQKLAFMQTLESEWNGAPMSVSRLGYTGEDGFEISLPASIAEQFASALADDEQVRPAGLGARDSLRLEAGLPLYGHDIDAQTDPVSAGLGFAIARRRRAEGGFPGAARIAELLKSGPAQKRVGLAIEGRMPAREGAPVFAGDEEVGKVISGGFSPSLGHPIAMAYVAADHAAPGARLTIAVRNRRLDATVVAMPFIPHNYHRSGAAK